MRASRSHLVLSFSFQFIIYICFFLYNVHFLNIRSFTCKSLPTFTGLCNKLILQMVLKDTCSLVLSASDFCIFLCMLKTVSVKLLPFFLHFVYYFYIKVFLKESLVLFAGCFLVTQVLFWFRTFWFYVQVLHLMLIRWRATKFRR